MSEMFTPPKYFQDAKFHRHTDRMVGWLELFYDLVYVATLIQIGNFLSDNLTLLGFGQFLVMIFVIWWAWTGKRCIRTVSWSMICGTDCWSSPRLLGFRSWVSA